MDFFEWDRIKSLSNKKKHGVSFGETIEIWKGYHLTVENIAYSKDGENRNATMGYIGKNIYTAIWTLREGRIRMISVRRSKHDEKEVFRKFVFQELN